MTTFALEPIFDSWLLLVVMAACLLGVPFLVRIHGDELDVSRRRWLIALRLASGLLLLLAALRPAVLTTDSLPSRATVTVLLDQSHSMTLPGAGVKSRWQVQLETWKTLAPALADLDDSLDVKVLGYSDWVNEFSSAELVALATEGADAAIARGPTGPATDLAAALSAALRTAAGQPLAGVVLMGDGVHNPPRRISNLTSTASPLSPATSGSAAASSATSASAGDPQNVARTLASLDVPLWTIPIGPPGDAGQVRDVEIDELVESLSVFSGNEFDVNFVVRSRALQGVEMPVRVWLTSESQPEQREEVAIRRITPTRSDDSSAVSISLIAPPPGAYRLEVTADPQDGETFLSNNAQYAFVDVRAGGGRVLYLEGQPRPEQTFIRRALRRFPDLEITYRWIAQDSSTNWPIDLSDLLRPGQFDIYLIGDLPAAALGNQQLQTIADAVDAGRGLLVIGGLDAFDAGGYSQSPLAAVLPIQLTAPGTTATHQITGNIAPKLMQLHPITTLNPDDASLAAQQAFWDSLPPLVGANRLGPPRVAPGINVLVETPQQTPLLVVGEYGGGRVAAFAGDTTWRWWRQGGDAAHRRFWRQIVLWLLDRGDDQEQDLVIEMTQRRFESGGSATWRVSHPAAPDQKLLVQTIAADGTATDIPAELVHAAEPVGNTLSDVPRSTTAGTLPPSLSAGMYRLRASIVGSETSAEKTFQVLDNDRELARPFADVTYLNQLSAQTTASGGASYLPSQVQELIDRIAELRRTSSSPVVQKHRLADTGATAWPLFLAIVALISAEWILRRRWGLV